MLTSKAIASFIDSRESASLDVVQCINSLVENVSLEVDGQSFFPDDFYLIDKHAYRTGNLETESNIGERVICVSSDEDSEEEFNRILNASRLMKKRQNPHEDDEEETSFIDSTGNTKVVEHEYDSLPALQRLAIRANDNVELKKLGNIVQIVDCLVVVQCDSNVALDFDSVLFDQNRNAVGQVFDIFGVVASPMYSIRFNSPNEAQQYNIGKAVYYAPSIEEYTHTVFTDQLKSLKIADSCWDGEGDCPDDQLAFSDDEAEKRYMAKKKLKKQKKFCSEDPSTSEPRTKKPNSEGNHHERLRGRNVSYAKRGRQNHFVSWHGISQSFESVTNPRFRPPNSFDAASFQPPPYFHPRFCGNVPRYNSLRNYLPRLPAQTNAVSFGQRANFENMWNGSHSSSSSSFTVPLSCVPSDGNVSPGVPSSAFEKKSVKEEEIQMFIDTRFVENENT